MCHFPHDRSSQRQMILKLGIFDGRKQLYTSPSQSLPNRLSRLGRHGRCFSMKSLFCPEGATQTLTKCLELCHLSQRLPGLKTTGWKIGKVWKRGVGGKVGLRSHMAWVSPWDRIVLTGATSCAFACWGPTSRIQVLNQKSKYSKNNFQWQ